MIHPAHACRPIEELAAALRAPVDANEVPGFGLVALAPARPVDSTVSFFAAKRWTGKP